MMTVPQSLTNPRRPIGDGAIYQGYWGRREHIARRWPLLIGNHTGRPDLWIRYIGLGCALDQDVPFDLTLWYIAKTIPTFLE